jgi:membrane protein required for colicin V production
MQFSQWTFLDFVFVGIILMSTGFALTKGLMRELVSVIALLGGFFIAVLYYRVPAAWFSGVFRTESLASLIGFLVIFIGCLMVGAIISFFINRFIKAASLEWVDRLLGGIFGFLRGWAVASIIVLAMVAFPVKEHLFGRSILAPYLIAGARAAVLLVPQELKDKFHTEYKKALDTLNEKRNPS